MDSLRYWLTAMGVDGFRFDLAPTLARQDGGFDRMSAFFDLAAQDPVLAPAKLIAEPWDVSQPDSHDVGRFPPEWSEWNGKYRDTMRDFWRRQGGLVGEFATRFSGSSDLYGGSRRRPTASVNLVTVHDGFTLAGASSSGSRRPSSPGSPLGHADGHRELDRSQRPSPHIDLDGGDDPDLAEDGTPLLDDDFLVLVNGWWEPLEFRVPDVGAARAWRVELDTYDPAPATSPGDLHAGDGLTLGPQSIVVLQSPFRTAT
jgi:pullulanase/glycogen debranching enzyme